MKIIVNKKLYVRSVYMAEIVDFYQYKYSRNNYYLNLVFTKDKINNIKKQGKFLAFLLFTIRYFIDYLSLSCRYLLQIEYGNEGRLR